MNKSTKIIGILFGIFLLVLIPIVDKNTYHHIVLCQTLVNIVVVTGLNFITGLTGQMNMGTAGIMALGAYSAALCSAKFQMPVVVGFIVAIVMGILIGKGLGYPSLRLKGVYLSLTTIGFSEITRLILTNWVGLTGGTMGVQNIPWINLFGIELNTSFRIYYFYLAIVIVITIMAYRIVHSKWGRVFKAIRDNVEAVEASGINIAEMKILAFTLATILGCFGGAMYTHMMGYINPTTFVQDLSANYRYRGRKCDWRCGHHDFAGVPAFHGKLLLVGIQCNRPVVCDFPAQWHCLPVYPYWSVWKIWSDKTSVQKGGRIDNE